ncbi:MAG: DUF2344 domain-containing protein [Clostridia bacterium]|nr:DUF2344 domain-containing protein [Clostridia bacterium]
MYKYRLTFSKTGYAKYVSHLDLLRMFQRAFQRAELPISYSQGFNPHQKISIAFPLPLGTTGTNEYMDIELDVEMTEDELLSRLNAALPSDIKVSDSKIPQAKTSTLKRASYTVEVELKNPVSDLDKKVEKLLNSDEIIVEKKTKKGISETDIKPSIISFEILDAKQQKLSMKLVLSCEDGASLKASVVADAMVRYIDGFEIDILRINREGLFLENMTEIC